MFPAARSGKWSSNPLPEAETCHQALPPLPALLWRTGIKRRRPHLLPECLKFRNLCRGRNVLRRAPRPVQQNNCQSLEPREHPIPNARPSTRLRISDDATLGFSSRVGWTELNGGLDVYPKSRTLRDARLKKFRRERWRPQGRQGPAFFPGGSHRPEKRRTLYRRGQRVSSKRRAIWKSFEPSLMFGYTHAGREPKGGMT